MPLKFIDKIAWIHLSEKGILGTRSKGKSVWYLPGGKREKGESDLETLKREIQEEVTAVIDVDSAKSFGVFEAPADGHGDELIVRMTCYTADYSGTLNPSAEIEEIKWLNNGDRDKISAASLLIFDELKERSLLA